jgi:hypothetical protein
MKNTITEDKIMVVAYGSLAIIYAVFLIIKIKHLKNG